MTTTIGQTSPKFREKLAQECAPYWETITAYMNIPTLTSSLVKGELYSGAPPIECSRKMVNIMFGMNLSMQSIIDCLNQCKLNRIAIMIQSECKIAISNNISSKSKNNSGFGWYNPILGEIQKHANTSMLFSRLCDALQMSQEYENLSHDPYTRVSNLLQTWQQKKGIRATNAQALYQAARSAGMNGLAELIEDNFEITEDQSGISMPPTMISPTTSMDSNLFSSNPFSMKKKKETFKTFVVEGNAFYVQMCTILNKHQLWLVLPRNYGVLSNPDAAKLVANLAEGWKHRENNPSDVIFKLLSDIEDFGNKSLEEFIKDLRTIENDEFQKVVDEFVAFKKDAIVSKTEKNSQVFNAATTLREFLLKTISTNEDVDEHIQRLINKPIGVKVPDDLKILSADDFIAGGFTRVEANKMVLAFKNK